MMTTVKNKMLERGDVRVRFQREGGFAPIPLRAEVDAASLSPEERDRLIQMIEAADFFNLPSRMRPRVGADQFTYTITVEAQGEKYTIETTDGSAPEMLEPLLDYLVEVATKKGR
jgi:hypothetical protein